MLNADSCRHSRYLRFFLASVYKFVQIQSDEIVMMRNLILIVIRFAIYHLIWCYVYLVNDFARTRRCMQWVVCSQIFCEHRLNLQSSCERLIVKLRFSWMYVVKIKLYYNIEMWETCILIQSNMTTTSLQACLLNSVYLMVLSMYTNGSSIENLFIRMLKYIVLQYTQMVYEAPSGIGGETNRKTTSLSSSSFFNNS